MKFRCKRCGQDYKNLWTELRYCVNCCNKIFGRCDEKV